MNIKQFHFPIHFLLNIVLNLGEKENLARKKVTEDESTMTQIYICFKISREPIIFKELSKFKILSINRCTLGITTYIHLIKEPMVSKFTKLKVCL